MSTEETKQRLTEFAAYTRTLMGDEKGEAQLFLERFFLALGHKGVKEAGATLEYRIAKKPGSSQLELLKDEAASALPKPKGGKKFADLLWPGRVLIEMKSRGQPLEKHYDQLFGYWTQIVPLRPAYAMLCNFDEVWIYDFNLQLFEPVDRIPMRELADRWSALGFLLPNPRKPIFDNNRVEVTRKAADRLAGVFKAIVGRGEARERAQRFVLQMVLAFVAEDLGLFRDAGLIVTELLGECKDGKGSAYDLIGGLFRQMANRLPAPEGRYAGVPYFNGGLFATVEPIALKLPELDALEDAAKEDWSRVKPEVFGTLFQESMDAGERHAFGAHFTSEFDIQKVVGPTVVRPWRERIEGAADAKELRRALADLRKFRVLDPACGSGNFLFVAYREMKRLERDILLRLRAKKAVGDAVESRVSIQQFFGIDKLPFAVELARVTLMLAKELELIEAAKLGETDGLFVREEPLPLDNLDANIVCADALFAEWPKADVIIGNPPFQSKNKMQQEFGADYVRKLRAAYPEIPGRADFCVYWFRKAQDQLSAKGRAGLVGTNTIRQNYSREGGLDYIVASGGIITDAVSTQVWSGDAAVHVSIANWTKGDYKGVKTLKFQQGDKDSSPWESFELMKINAALALGQDVTNAERLATNANAAACFQGQTHGHEGFLLTLTEGKGIKDRSTSIMHPYLTAEEMIGNFASKPSRISIDFNRYNDMFSVKNYPAAYEIIKERVLPTMRFNAEQESKHTGKSTGPRQTHFQRWWKFWRGRLEMLDAIEGVSRYVACGQVTKRPIFEFVSSRIRPNAALMVFPFNDDYSFGILQSNIHWLWFVAKCSTLEERFRYTSDTVFDTFAWPQKPTTKQARVVADAAVALRALRREVMGRLKYSLRELYRTLDEPGDNALRNAHAALDAAVRAAYGMAKEDDPLAFLLDLNLRCAAREKAGEAVTPPGLPGFVAESEEERAAFVTEDCVRVS